MLGPYTVTQSQACNYAFNSIWIFKNYPPGVYPPLPWKRPGTRDTYPQKGHGSKDTYPPKQTPVKTLPSLYLFRGYDIYTLQFLFTYVIDICSLTVQIGSKNVNISQHCYHLLLLFNCFLLNLSKSNKKFYSLRVREDSAEVATLCP